MTDNPFKQGDRVVRMRGNKWARLEVGDVGTVSQTRGAYVSVSYDRAGLGEVTSSANVFEHFSGTLTASQRECIVRAKLKEALNHG